MGQVLKNGISEVVGKHGITNVRGIGLMIGIECETKEKRDAVLNNLFKNGLLMLGAGQKSIRVIPPLTINQEQIDEGISILHQACKDQ